MNLVVSPTQVFANKQLQSCIQKKCLVTKNKDILTVPASLTGLPSVRQLVFSLATTVTAAMDLCDGGHGGSWVCGVSAARGLRQMPAAEGAPEGVTELGGEGVVEDGVDGAVDVDAGLGEHEVPEVHEGAAGGEGGHGVVDHQAAPGQPQGREDRHHRYQHLHHLREQPEEKTPRFT